MKSIYSLQNGFLLMEMMVVMLVISIILALSAPMITKKLPVQEQVPAYGQA